MSFSNLAKFVSFLSQNLPVVSDRVYHTKNQLYHTYHGPSSPDFWSCDEPLSSSTTFLLCHFALTKLASLLSLGHSKSHLEPRAFGLAISRSGTVLDPSDCVPRSFISKTCPESSSQIASSSLCLLTLGVWGFLFFFFFFLRTYQFWIFIYLFIYCLH